MINIKIEKCSVSDEQCICISSSVHSFPMLSAFIEHLLSAWHVINSIIFKEYTYSWKCIKASKRYVKNQFLHSSVKVTQSYPTLCDLMDYTVHGILQARILGWVAFPFSRGDRKSTRLNSSHSGQSRMPSSA